MFGWKTAAGAIGTFALGASILGATFGATALAAPANPTTAPATVDKDGHARDRIKDVLDKLVEKGVITQDQEKAILEAFAKAHGDHDRGDRVEKFLGNVLEESARYLQMSVDDLKAKLAQGKSLGEIANQTPNKSRQGLIDTLSRVANERIKDAVEKKQITPEQAEKLRSMVDGAVVRVVDHERKKTTS